MFYNKNGANITFDQWLDLQNDPEYVRVGLLELPTGYKVSTVWLGLNHNLSETAPIYFETIVYGKDGGIIELERYGSLQDAAVGHSAFVAKFSADETRHES